MLSDVKREITEIWIRQRGIKVKNCHVRTLIGHRGTNWKRRRWHLASETKTCLFRVLFLRCTTTATRVTPRPFADCCSGTGFPPLRLQDSRKRHFLKSPRPTADPLNLCVRSGVLIVFPLCLCLLLQSTRALIMTIK